LFREVHRDRHRRRHHQDLDLSNQKQKNSLFSF